MSRLFDEKYRWASESKQSKTKLLTSFFTRLLGLLLNTKQWLLSWYSILCFYLFLWSWAGGILRILQSDWFRKRAVFSYLLTTVMVTSYAKRRVKLRIERAKFQFVLIIFCNRAVLLFNFLIKKAMASDESYPSDVICWHVDETMCKIKTWLFQFFLVVSPTF